MKSIKRKHIVALAILLLAVLLNQFPRIIYEKDFQIKICEEDSKIKDVEKSNVDEKSRS